MAFVFKKKEIILILILRCFVYVCMRVQITFILEGNEDTKIKVENANAVEMIKKCYLVLSRGVFFS